MSWINWTTTGGVREKTVGPAAVQVRPDGDGWRVTLGTSGLDARVMHRSTDEAAAVEFADTLVGML